MPRNSTPGTWNDSGSPPARAGRPAPPTGSPAIEIGRDSSRGRSPSSGSPRPHASPAPASTSRRPSDSSAIASEARTDGAWTGSRRAWASISRPRDAASMRPRRRAWSPPHENPVASWWRRSAASRSRGARRSDLRSTGRSLGIGGSRQCGCPAHRSVLQRPVGSRAAGSVRAISSWRWANGRIWGSPARPPAGASNPSNPPGLFPSPIDRGEVRLSSSRTHPRPSREKGRPLLARDYDTTRRIGASPNRPQWQAQRAAGGTRQLDAESQPTDSLPRLSETDRAGGCPAGKAKVKHQE